LRILRTLLIGLVILWGLLALLVRTATPFMVEYRGQLASELSVQLGATVAIGDLKARWYGLHPLLEIYDVVVGRAGERLHIGRATVDVSAKEWLFGSLLDALRITIERMQLTLVREASGQVRLEGFGPLFEGSGLRLPRRLHLVDTQVVWIDRRANTPPVSIDDVDLVVVRRDSSLRLRGSLDSEAGRADLWARVHGSLTSTDWRGESYLRVDGLDVARFFAPYIPHSYGLRGMDLDLESWTDWQAAAPTHTQGRVEIRGLDLQPAPADGGPLRIARAAGQFTFDRDADGWRAGLHDLQLTTHGRPWPLGDLALAAAPLPAGGHRIRAAADYLRIQDVIDILEVRQPWPDLHEPLAALRPRGELHNLRLQAVLAPDRTDWRATTDFEGIAAEPSGRIPGFDRLRGRLHLQPDHLRLELASSDAIVHMPRLFREPLALQTLDGRVDLLLHDGGWRLHSHQIQADARDIATRTRIDLRVHTGRRPWIDLQTDFRDADAALVKRYFPAGILSEGLLRWLDRAFVSGRVRSGTALLHGPLQDFPFETSHTGIFRTAFAVDDMVLDYSPGWPPIEQLDAQVVFHGGQVTIEADSGKIYDSRITDTRAHIASLRPPNGIEIQGQIDGPLEDILQVLQEDALRQRFGKFAAAMRGAGETRLALNFIAPLSEDGPRSLDGKLHFDDATLALTDWDLVLDRVRGELDFTLDGLSAEGISGRALRAPVTLDVLSTSEGATRIRTQGTFTVPNIARHLPNLPLQTVGGKAAFVVDVDLPADRTVDDSAALLTVRSDLEGINIDLPAPIGKTAAESRSLTVSVPLGGHTATGTLDYAGELSAAFSGDAQRVDLAFGDSATLGPDRGIRVSGRLQQLDLSAWRNAIASLSIGERGDTPPLNVDLEIDRLLAEPLAIDRLKLRLARRAGIWWGAAEAPDIAGSFRFAQARPDTPMRVDLARLYLRVPVAEQGAPPMADTDTQRGPDPADLPGLTLGIADLRINQAELGRLNLVARRAPEGLRISELSLHDGQVALEGHGSWSSAGGSFSTHVQGEATTGGLGDLLVDLGYSRQVEGADGDFRFDLSWPGNPMQGRRPTLQGTLGLDIGAGRLVELDPGVTRVVGLLNLNALTRRLRLDFRDVYKKGYSFDRISGNFRFGNGEARTDDLSVLGPTGSIDLRGSADLIGGTLAQQVTVTPKLDATLPIAGALAGGPVAGVAVLMAQQVLTKQVDDITRFEYEVNGPWESPDIVQLDTGGTLSKIYKQMKRGAGPAPSGDEDIGVPTPNAPPEDSTARTAPALPPDEREAVARPMAAGDPAGDAGSKIPRPLRGLMDLLEKGEPYGADLPGEVD
jgi:uncharacterized protein (TIGR02099 family)